MRNRTLRDELAEHLSRHGRVDITLTTIPSNVGPYVEVKIAVAKLWHDVEPAKMETYCNQTVDRARRWLDEEGPVGVRFSVHAEVMS